MPNDTVFDQKMPPIRQRLSTKRTLELSGIKSPKTLRKYVVAGKFPAPIRITPGRNGRLEWYQDEVLAHLDAKRVVPDTAAVSNPGTPEHALGEQPAKQSIRRATEHQLERPEPHAVTVARLVVKRLYIPDAEAPAVDEAEAHLMIEVITKLQRVLDTAGYSLR